MKKKKAPSVKVNDCPKCGDRGMGHFLAEEEKYHIACLGCHARTVLLPTAEEAIKAWNDGEVSVPERLVKHAESG